MRKYRLMTVLNLIFLRKRLLKPQLQQLMNLLLPQSQLMKIKVKKMSSLSRLLPLNRLTKLLKLRRKKKFLSLKLSQSKKYQLMKFLNLRTLLKKMFPPLTMNSLCSTQRLPWLFPLPFLSTISIQFSACHSQSGQSFRKKISLRNACISSERIPMTSLK